MAARKNTPDLTTMLIALGGAIVSALGTAGATRYGEEKRIKDAVAPLVEYRVGQVETDLKEETRRREAADARGAEAQRAADKLVTRYDILEGQVLTGLSALTSKVQGIETSLAKEEGRRSAANGPAR